MRWNFDTVRRFDDRRRRSAMKIENRMREKRKNKIRTSTGIAYVRSYCSLSGIWARVLVIYFITTIFMKCCLLSLSLSMPLCLSPFILTFSPISTPISLFRCLLAPFRPFQRCLFLPFSLLTRLISSHAFSLSVFFLFPFTFVSIALSLSLMCTYYWTKSMKSVMRMIQKSSENKCLLNISSSLCTCLSLQMNYSVGN